MHPPKHLLKTFSNPSLCLRGEVLASLYEWIISQIHGCRIDGVHSAKTLHFFLQLVRTLSVAPSWIYKIIVSLPLLHPHASTSSSPDDLDLDAPVCVGDTLAVKLQKAELCAVLRRQIPGLVPGSAYYPLLGRSRKLRTLYQVLVEPGYLAGHGVSCATEKICDGGVGPSNGGGRRPSRSDNKSFEDVEDVTSGSSVLRRRSNLSGGAGTHRIAGGAGGAGNNLTPHFSLEEDLFLNHEAVLIGVDAPNSMLLVEAYEGGFIIRWHHFLIRAS